MTEKTTSSISDELEKENKAVDEDSNSSKTGKGSSKVSSRYLQSARDYPLRQRVPSIRGKKPAKTPSNRREMKASTPLSTPYSGNAINVSNLSSIGGKSRSELTTVVDHAKPVIKEPLMQADKLSRTMITRQTPMLLLPVGQDAASRKKNIERGVLEAQYLQSLWLRLSAEESLRSVEAEGMSQIERVWKTNDSLSRELGEKMRKLAKVEKQLEHLKLVEDQKKCLCQHKLAYSSMSTHLKFLQKQLEQRSCEAFVRNLPLKNEEIEAALVTQARSGSLAKSEFWGSVAANSAKWCRELERSLDTQQQSFHYFKSITEIINKRATYEKTRIALKKNGN